MERREMIAANTGNIYPSRRAWQRRRLLGRYPTENWMDVARARRTEDHAARAVVIEAGPAGPDSGQTARARDPSRCRANVG